ncbi:hypothetical protein [Paraburkholderia sp.]|uniref:hypothetical protein n=1 Tax=Paraburkholderia sp. TaxID=1926495 RepID=UPI00239FEE1E|nr:hypothetical protein [Paraburkholderia sp.]MDE1181774.1 hypothetical protein [Paraburkholderia sp.]
MPCQLCGGALYQHVEFCPYCGAIHPLAPGPHTRLVPPAKPAKSIRLPLKAPHLATAKLATDEGELPPLASPDTPIPPLAHPPSSWPVAKMLSRVMVLLLAVIAVGFAAHVLIGEKAPSKTTATHDDEAAQSAAGTIEPSGPKATTTATAQLAPAPTPAPATPLARPATPSVAPAIAPAIVPTIAPSFAANKPIGKTPIVPPTAAPVITPIIPPASKSTTLASIAPPAVMPTPAPAPKPSLAPVIATAPTIAPAPSTAIATPAANAPHYRSLADSLQAARTKMLANDLTGSQAALNAAFAMQPDNADAQMIQRNLRPLQQRRDIPLQSAKLCAKERVWSCVRQNASTVLTLDTGNADAKSLLESAILQAGWLPLATKPAGTTPSQAATGATANVNASPNTKAAATAPTTTAPAPTPPTPTPAPALSTAANQTARPPAANSVDAQERAILENGWKRLPASAPGAAKTGAAP